MSSPNNDSFAVPDDDAETERQLREELEALDQLADEDFDEEFDLLGEEEMMGVVLDTSLITLKKHEDAVLNCALLPGQGSHGEGISCVTSGQDERVVFWEVDNAVMEKAVRSCVEGGGDEQGLSDEAALPTEENVRAAMAAEVDGEVLEGKVVAEGKHLDSVLDVVVNAAGTLLASVGYDNAVKIWDLKTREVISTLSGPTEEMEWGCWHPKGDVFLSGSADTTVWMWQAKSGQVMNVFVGHPEAVSCGAFVISGRYIATGAKDGSVIVWDPKSAAQLHKFSFQKEVTCLAAGTTSGKTGQYFAIGCSDGSVYVCTYAESGGKVVSKMDCRSGVGGRAARQEYLGGGQGTAAGRTPVRAANKAAGEEPMTAGKEESAASSSNMGEGGEDSPMANADEEPQIAAVDEEVDQDLQDRLAVDDDVAPELHDEDIDMDEEANTDTVECVAFQPSPSETGALLAVASLDGSLRIFETKTFTTRCHIPDAHAEGIVAMRWLVQEAKKKPLPCYLLLTCSLDGTCKLWSARDGELLRTFSGHADAVMNCDAVLEKGAVTLLTVSDDKTAKIWRHELGALEG